MTITGAARLAGIMGWPIAHSRSPLIHNFWLETYGIDGAYVPFAVSPDRLEPALRALPALGLRGVNLTIPHKEAGLALSDQLDDTARRIGAVNTIVVADDGSLHGGNTDAFGFLEGLTDAASSWRAADGPAVVLGAGGAARAILVALIDAGVAEIRLLNRTAARAETLATELGPVLRTVPWEERADALDGASLLVNATSLGMDGHQPLDLRLDALPRDAVVYDIVYVPLTTPLLADAARRGNRTVDGLSMLLHQARPGFSAWFGRDPEVTDALRDRLIRSLDE